MKFWKLFSLLLMIEDLGIFVTIYININLLRFQLMIPLHHFKEEFLNRKLQFVSSTLDTPLLSSHSSFASFSFKVCRRNRPII